MLALLGKALRVNKTLVKLDLSHNGLKTFSAKFIIKALHDNMTLTELNLGYNYLDSSFAKDLAYLLEHNEVLHKVVIEDNPVRNMN
jgi:Ran GTPase-activating protein (RanGAP) involved in mRNA processing and transport